MRIAFFTASLFLAAFSALTTTINGDDHPVAKDMEEHDDPRHLASPSSSNQLIIPADDVRCSEASLCKFGSIITFDFTVDTYNIHYCGNPQNSQGPNEFSCQIHPRVSPIYPLFGASLSRTYAYVEVIDNNGYKFVGSKRVTRSSIVRAQSSADDGRYNAFPTSVSPTNKFIVKIYECIRLKTWRYSLFSRRDSYTYFKGDLRQTLTFSSTCADENNAVFEGDGFGAIEIVGDADSQLIRPMGSNPGWTCAAP